MVLAAQKIPGKGVLGSCTTCVLSSILLSLIDIYCELSKKFKIVMNVSFDTNLWKPLNLLDRMELIFGVGNDRGSGYVACDVDHGSGHIQDAFNTQDEGYPLQRDPDLT